jgi:hypothetical protein
VRRFLVLLQMLLLALPTFASVVTVRNAAESLPACCRRAGAHHCAMPETQRVTRTSGVAIAAKPEPCPFSPKAMPAAQHAPASLLPAAAFFAEIVSHPAVVAQTLTKLRIARDRSRQKRGPPQQA